MDYKMHLTILEKQGGMLLVEDYSGNVYTTNFETGAMEMAAHFDKTNHGQVVPIVMDWPTLFVSRLSKCQLRSKK